MVTGVGRVGTRRVAGAPTADVHAAALALLVALGRDGGGELRTLLEELRAADERNEALAAGIEQRMRELEGLEQREVAVQQAEARAGAALTKLLAIRDQLAAIDV